jgi:four helix bundle protein
MADQKKFDLEERTFRFARNVRVLLNANKHLGTSEDRRQLLRSSGSVAANYVEANEALSRNDFFLRVRICRKEAKESHLWLRLIQETGASSRPELAALMQEAIELAKIFSAIAQKSPEINRTEK